MAIDTKVYIPDHKHTPNKRGYCIFPVPVGAYFVPCGKMRGLHA